MFFNKYEYEDASNNYSLETIDYRIAEEKYDPSENNTLESVYCVFRVAVRPIVILMRKLENTLGI